MVSVINCQIGRKMMTQASVSNDGVEGNYQRSHYALVTLPHQNFSGTPPVVQFSERPL